MGDALDRHTHGASYRTLLRRSGDRAARHLHRIGAMQRTMGAGIRIGRRRKHRRPPLRPSLHLGIIGKGVLPEVRIQSNPTIVARVEIIREQHMSERLVISKIHHLQSSQAPRAASRFRRASVSVKRKASSPTARAASTFFSKSSVKKASSGGYPSFRSIS